MDARTSEMDDAAFWELAADPGAASLGERGPGGNGRNGGTPAVKVDEPPKFDLESYIGNYMGRTKFSRLYLIGSCSTYLSTEALKLAVAEAKAGKDVRNYEMAVGALAAVAPSESEAVLDTAWVEHTSKVVQADTDRLEHELKGYKNNLIKESIRMGNEDLGQHYHRIGDLAAASKAYSRMRDFCTTTSHVASMYFKNINVAVDRGDWLGVQAQVYRLRNLQFKPEDEAKNKAKISASLGLSQLATGAYRDAATSFASTDPSLADNYKEVISSNDVAVYGGLCALASMDRNELMDNILENKSFRNFLELEPHIRRAISFFCASKFRLCLDILESYRTDYLLDLHLQKHVAELYSRIRTKAIQQYIIPFSRITLDSMAKIFAPGESITTTTSSSPFITYLTALIQDNTLSARLDLENFVLVTNQTNHRTETLTSSLTFVKEYLDNAHVQLLRLNIVHAGLEVPDPHSRGGPADSATMLEEQGGAGGYPMEFEDGDWSTPGMSAYLDTKGLAGKLGKAFGGR